MGRILALLGSVLLGRALAAALEVDVQPATLAPGEPVRITVRGAGEQPVHGRFLDRDLTFIPGDGAWVAFAGVDLTVQPGRRVLEVRAGSTDDENLLRRLELEIEHRDYPTEHLEVAPRFVNPPPEVSERIQRESAALNEIWSRATPGFLHDGRVVRPLSGVTGRNFGRRRVFNGEPRSPHSGTDLSAPTGTPVEAAAAGEVVLARDLYYSGNLVVVDHGGGVYTLYAHLSRMHVAEGDVVQAGAVIGRVGATGRVTGPHLHWGARIGAARVDPDRLLRLVTESTP